MRRTRQRLLVATLAMAAAACSDSAGPVPLEGDHFVLTSIAGIGLPAPWAPNPVAQERMLAASLVLQDDGSGTWMATVETSVSGPTVTWNDDVTWQRSGNHVEIDIECDDLGSCIAGPHFVGEITDDGFTVTTSSVTRPPLVFHRVEPGPG